MHLGIDVVTQIAVWLLLILTLIITTAGCTKFTSIISNPRHLKYSVIQAAQIYNKSIPDGGVTSSTPLRVALVDDPAYVASCAFDNPPCPNCGGLEICGGFDYKFVKYSLGPVLGREPEIVRAHGINPSDTGVTVLGLLNRSDADISCQFITLDYGRNQYARNAFPLFFTDYVAVVKFPKGLNTAIVENVSLGAFILLLLFVVLYLTNKTLYTFAEELPLTTASDYITQMSMAFFWLVVAVVLSYIGSAVTLILYRPSMPATPFTRFSELADGMKDFRYNIFTPYNITIEKLFNQKEAGGVLEQLYEAAQVNPPKVVPLFDAVGKVIESYSNVAILTDYGDRRIVNQKYCTEIMEIHDQGELPTEMHGCYFGENFQKRFDWYERHILTNSYYAWMNYYTWNKTSECGLSGSGALDALARRRVAPLNLKQLKLFFLFVLTGGAFGFGVFVLEHLHSFKAKRTKVVGIENRQMDSGDEWCEKCDG